MGIESKLEILGYGSTPTFVEEIRPGIAIFPRRNRRALRRISRGDVFSRLRAESM